MLERAGVDPQARGEQLTVEDFLRIRAPRHPPPPEAAAAGIAAAGHSRDPLRGARPGSSVWGMTEGSIGSSRDAAGDRSVREATGRTHEEWFALLDEAGASEWRTPRSPRGS